MLALGMTACSAESTIPSFLFSMDKVPPSVTNIQPSGMIKTSSTTASATFNDSGAGINSATAVVYLDNVAIVGCKTTESGISCPTQGLAEGAHSLTVEVKDVAGNINQGAGQFIVDSMAPAVVGFSPTGVIGESPTTVSVTYSESGSGVIVSSVVVSIDGRVLMGCMPTATSVNCPAAGIGPGEHTIRISVTDSAGFTGTGSGTFIIPPPQPSTPPPSSPSNCDPNYSGCVPRASDVDCAGGSGNGPAYVAGPISVIGTDIYGLDRDNDGIACE